MTIQELRIFLGEWFCGCGSPDVAVKRLRDILALHPLYDHRKEFEHLIPDEGLQYLVLYTLDHFDLSEHGGTVGGAWLTPKGQAVLDAINRESADGFDRITAACCVHGYAIDDELIDCAECGALNRRRDSLSSHIQNLPAAR